MIRVDLERNAGADGRIYYGRKNQEYVADFCLVARRSLTPGEYRVFKYRYLLGADWRLCSKRLKIDRGTLFHIIYRIEQRLGRTFRELEPYALYPLSDYFGLRDPRAAKFVPGDMPFDDEDDPDLPLARSA
ncbi:MAG: hypothetical protein HYZ57_00515 [Acidobacteria bacterium]|nr:hypothetical protein [Acidobacteriota bacterium]MBI3278305.1 hypothetical protein [Acidobacteriota bacterium]